MKALILVGVCALSFLLTFVTNWLALIPWRRTKEMHWTERARRLFPVAQAVQSNGWVVPIDMALAVQCVWRGNGPHWLLVAVVAWLGCLFSGYAYSREVYPAVTPRAWLRQAMGAVVFQTLRWFVLLAAIGFMPDHMHWPAWTLFFGMVAWYLFLNFGGLLWIGSIIGLFVNPPERLCQLVGALAVRLKVTVRKIYVWPIWIANAFAFTSGQSLVFTKRLLEVTPEDELSSIIAHELAHLTEPRGVRLMRLLTSYSFLPMILIKPLVEAYGLWMAVVIPVTCMLILRLTMRFSRKLEVRADKIAAENQTEAGIYARALLRIHKVNLIPLVTAAQGTHPPVYDRIVAAGVTPDFPRPAPSGKMAWHGQIFSALLGALMVICFIRLRG